MRKEVKILGKGKEQEERKGISLSLSFSLSPKKNADVGVFQIC